MNHWLREIFTTITFILIFLFASYHVLMFRGELQDYIFALCHSNEIGSGNLTVATCVVCEFVSHARWQVTGRAVSATWLSPDLTHQVHQHKSERCLPTPHAPWLQSQTWSQLPTGLLQPCIDTHKHITVTDAWDGKDFSFLHMCRHQTSMLTNATTYHSLTI